MTRNSAAPEPVSTPVASEPDPTWRLQDAKARFSELVRLAHSEGPQHVTVHGRAAVVVVDAETFQRLQGKRSGHLLVEALAASPYRTLAIEPGRSPMPVRAVKL